MLEYRQKRKIRRIFFSPVMMVFLLVIVFILAKATWNVRKKALESQVYLAQAQSQLDKASSTLATLASSVAALNTPAGVETDIRSQFLVAKPGEQVAVIVDSDASASAGVSGSGDVAGLQASNMSASAAAAAAGASAGGSSGGSSGGFWQKLWDFFKF